MYIKHFTSIKLLYSHGLFLDLQSFGYLGNQWRDINLSGFMKNICFGLWNVMVN